MPFDLVVPRVTYRPASLAVLANAKPVGGDRFRATVPGELTIKPSLDDPEPLEHTVVMGLDVVDGRLACTSLCLRTKDGEPAALTTEALRRVPVGRYLQWAASNGLTVMEAGDNGEMYPFVPPPPDFAEAGISDEVLKNVARLYYWARATGDAPLGLLEREYGVPRGKASRWIATARRRGYVRDDSDGS